jgi:hypothetical protein
MIETLTLITLCILYLIFFRPGKTPPLKNSLVIDRPGKYHVTLAPHLNLAQPLVEGIAQQLLEPAERSGDSNTLFFEVRDKNAAAHGHEAYLLAITQRDGILFFQATAPAGNSAPLQIINFFSHNVLARFPQSDEPDISIDQEIVRAAQQVANQRRVEIAQIM